MKKNLLVIGFMLVAAISFSSCGSGPAKEKQTPATEVAEVQYTCPMHPEVVSDKPGECPECGMDLVAKK